jgi:hypothetical protein
MRAALLLGSLTLAAQAHAADALVVEVTSRDGCPAEAWFREQLDRRGVRGYVRASLGADPGAEGYAGDIAARTDAGAAVSRRLTGAQCATVAEGLLVVAEVHLAGLKANPPPVVLPPFQPPIAPVAPPAAAPAPVVRFALGALGTVDSVVTGDPAFGGGVTAWLAVGSRPLRGFALSASYSRADVTKTVPLTHEHLRARVDLIPLDLAIDAATSLGFSVFLSGGYLHAAAHIERSTPGGRSLWLTGAGARLRRHIGPVFLELVVDGTLAITRRNFEVNGVDGPIFSLPLFGVASTLSAGVPIGP